ncbi:MAG: 2-hydroxyacid dehydrogenase [Carbonactinosporaceae bacterium]
MWLPYPDAVERMGGAPEGVEVEVYDGAGEPPDSIGDVEFYVPPYTFALHTVELIPRMARLRVVQTLTAGVEHVRPYVGAGVTLCNARGVHDASTAELAVTLTLASLRGIPKFVRAHQTGEWHAGFYDALADRTVLIVGYGSVGAAVERRLAGFEVEVLRAARAARDGVHGLDALPELLPRADVVVLCVPATPHTQGMVDAGFLARMKDGALLVNVARGPVVDTAALLAECERGRLLAALDVTDPEPLPPGHPLWRAPGVLISPHVGGSSSAFLPRAMRLMRDQLHRYAAGEPLVNVITQTY